MKRLFTLRLDIFLEYTENGSELACGQSFEIIEEVSFTGSERSLYLRGRR